MLYCIIKPDYFPEVVFAHSLTEKNYQTDTPSSQSHMEITYVKSGSVKFTVQNTEFVAQEGSFIIHCHKFPFALHTINDEVHIHYTVSIDLGNNITLQSDPNSYDHKLGHRISVPVYIPPCQNTDDYLNKLNDIIRTYHSTDKNGAYKAACMTVSLLCDLSQGPVNNYTFEGEVSYHSQNIYSDRIKNYIHSHISQDISLSDISAAIGKSPNYLNHVFKEINNITIRQYINFERTKKAAELILKKQYSLKQAAEQVGVHDANYLSRMFKKQFGVSVSEFKNNSLESTFSMIDPKKGIF